MSKKKHLQIPNNMRKVHLLFFLFLLLAACLSSIDSKAQGCGCGINAGVQKEIVLGQEVHFEGSSSGTVVSGPVWSLIAGPEGALITDAKNLSSSIVFSNPGTYVFKLSAICLKEMKAEDQVTIIVLPQ
jgi:hypothetical protein